MERERPEAQGEIEICRDGELQPQGDKLRLRPGVGTSPGRGGRGRREGPERAPRARLAGQGGGTSCLGRGLASQCPRVHASPPHHHHPPPPPAPDEFGEDVGRGSLECAGRLTTGKFRGQRWGFRPALNASLPNSQARPARPAPPPRSCHVAPGLCDCLPDRGLVLVKR